LVDPYASPPVGACGWVNGANAGVCARQYSNGWAYINAVCQYDGTACGVASTAVTIPPATSGSRWYDQYCNVVPDGRYALAAATALVIARGSADVCPWPNDACATHRRFIFVCQKPPHSSDQAARQKPAVSRHDPIP